MQRKRVNRKERKRGRELERTRPYQQIYLKTIKRRSLLALALVPSEGAFVKRGIPLGIKYNEKTG